VLTEFNPIRLVADAMNGLSKYLFGFDLYAADRNILGRLVSGVTEKMDRIGAAFDEGVVKGVATVLREFDLLAWVAQKMNALVTCLFGIDLAAGGRQMLDNQAGALQAFNPLLT
jgi:hypothetical protein